MISKVVALTAVLVAAALIGPLGPLPAAAQTGPTASRSLSAESVNAGDPLTVTIEAVGYGSFADVVETLSGECSYVSTNGVPSDQVTVDGQEVTFTLIGVPAPATFTYIVEASDEGGSCTFSGEFSGVLADFNAFSGVQVGGTSSITVEAPATSGPTASRSLSAESVNAGDPLTVTITADGYGSFADVVETLSGECSYVSTSGVPSDQVSVDGQEVTFTLIGVPAPATFTYIVEASDEGGSCTFSGEFSGVLADFDVFSGVQVGGTSSITVAGPMASRSLSAESVNTGDPLTVTITADGYGSFADVVETLSGECSYVSTSGVPSDQVSVNGQEVTFTLIGVPAPATFTYIVEASDEEGSCTFSGEFSGVLVDFTAFSGVTVGGPSSVTVEAKTIVTPTPEPTTTDDVAPMVTWNVPQALVLNVRIRPISPITEDDIASYAIEKGQLPRVLRLDETTGVITGRPGRETSAATTVTIKVCDTSGKCASFELRFPRVVDPAIVDSTPTPTLPRVSEPDLTGVTVGGAAPSSGLQIALAAAGGTLLLGGAGIMAARRRARVKR